MRIIALLAALLGTGSMCVYAQEAVPFRIHGQSWTDVGRVMKASDSIVDTSLTNVDYANFSHNALQNVGAQLVVDADLGSHWSASFGIGAVQTSTALGKYNQTTTYDFLSISLFKIYIAEANLTYSLGDKGNPWLTVTAGNFAYDYNPEVKNLGLYLLRGPVYPGLLMSGFQQFETDTSKATQTGFKIHNAFGNFSQDLLFIQERMLPPTFDWSLAYVAKYRLFNALELGAGVNFYRLVPYSSPLETPGRISGNEVAGGAGSFGDAVPNYEVNSSGDTVFYTHQGTKLMAMFDLDLKQWLTFEHMGSEDFKVYGEAAILGVKNYGSFYNKMSQRIPVMGGFNIPTFGVLDLLSLEVEWYGSPYRDDLSHIGNPSSIVAPWMSQNPPVSSPVPVLPGAYPDSTRDNWKWSVVLNKKVAKHVGFTAQIANDHYRPSPMPSSIITSVGGNNSVLTSPSDWYFMGRLGFFF